MLFKYMAKKVLNKFCFQKAKKNEQNSASCIYIYKIKKNCSLQSIKLGWLPLFVISALKFPIKLIRLFFMG